MKEISIQIIVLLLISFCAQAQTKVANYSYGTSGTAAYEHFSFWVKNNQRTKVEYSYGADRKETVLKYAGKSGYKGQQAFTVSFQNGYKLYIIPKGNQLQVTDSSGKYNKTFTWEYEGPVEGIGTYCDVCAHEENAAMKIVKTAFIK